MQEEAEAVYGASQTGRCQLITVREDDGPGKGRTSTF